MIEYLLNDDEETAHVQPSLTGLNAWCAHPALSCWAIFSRPGIAGTLLSSDPRLRNAVPDGRRDSS